MKHKFDLFQGVVLTKDLPDSGLAAGTFGVVMELLPRDGIAVEFFDADERTIEVVMIPEKYVRAETKVEGAARLATESARNPAET